MLTAKSCDTFVALPPSTQNGCVIFGKNADRPCAEVQEVVSFPASDHEAGAKLECTYIEIDQIPHTHAVVLSKPAWMWGAEIGANEMGVCIGNEAVFTKFNSSEDTKEKLLGMDLLRLGLERSKTAEEAVNVITELLEAHGQGGPCSEEPGSAWAYHNSFLIADRKEAWVLETAAKHWAAEQIESGIRNISNQLTIRTKIDKMSSGLKDIAKDKGYWNPDDGDFDFAKVISDSFEETKLGKGDTPCGRQQWGTRLLEEKSEGGSFSAKNMFEILRHEDSGICMTGSFVSAGSMVSVLPQSSGNSPCCHWLTATPNPSLSMFKPFVFCDGASIGNLTISPQYGDKDPVKITPRFQKSVDRDHPLYAAHKYLEKLFRSNKEKAVEILKQMHELEDHCIGDMEEILKNFDSKSSMRIAPIFQHMADLELNFYKMGGYNAK